MRDAGRRTAQTRFCSTLVVPHYVRYYEQVLANQVSEIAG
jgi:peroxiredoxin